MRWKGSRAGAIYGQASTGMPETTMKDEALVVALQEEHGGPTAGVPGEGMVGIAEKNVPPSRREGELGGGPRTPLPGDLPKRLAGRDRSVQNRFESPLCPRFQHFCPRLRARSLFGVEQHRASYLLRVMRPLRVPPVRYTSEGRA